MVWSEYIGSGITIPGDIDPAAPYSNFVTIGANIPDDLVGIMSTAIIAYNAAEYPVARSRQGVQYWVLGIDNGGNFALMARTFYNNNAPTANPVGQYEVIWSSNVPNQPGPAGFTINTQTVINNALKAQNLTIDSLITALRLNLLGTADVSNSTTSPPGSTQNPLVIGNQFTQQHMIFDVNEIMSRNADGTINSFIAWHATAGDAQQPSGGAYARKDYADTGGTRGSGRITNSATASFMAAATNWTLNAVSYVRDMGLGMRSIYIEAVYNGTTAITANSVGDIPNTLVGTVIATHAPVDIAPMAPAGYGVQCSGHINSAGQVFLDSIPPNFVLNAGSGFNLACPAYAA